MTKFESEVKTLYAPQERVYEKLSDLNNLEKVRDRIPMDKIKEFSFDSESITIGTPVGKVTMAIVEKEPCKTIKFGTTSSPLPFNLWIQLLPTSTYECKMKLTIGIEMNSFMLGMVKKPLQEGVERIANALAMIQF